MVYGYKITDGNITPMGASDSLERLTKALTMANISTKGMLTQDTELVMAGGKYFLSADDEEYKTLKAEEEAERERLASLPTIDDRVETLEADNESMNDLLLGVIDIIDSLTEEE